MAGDDLGWPKLTASCCFLLLHYSGELLLEAFSDNKGLFWSGSRMSFIPASEGNSLEVMVWPEVAWSGRMHADKVAV